MLPLQPRAGDPRLAAHMLQPLRLPPSPGATWPLRHDPDPATARPQRPAHRRHLRSLRVNVSSSFAIVDGEIGPDNVFAVDPESSFDNHVVCENQAKEYWVARASLLRSCLEDKTDPWENKG